MTPRDPRRDPRKGDVLIKGKTRRTVVDGKRGEPPFYVVFTDAAGEKQTTGLPAWRAWAKSAELERTATDFGWKSMLHFTDEAAADLRELVKKHDAGRALLLAKLVLDSLEPVPVSDVAHKLLMDGPPPDARERKARR